MAGLVLSLKANEKFLVNGALLSNGPKRGQICVDGEGVNVLRMSDVIHPNDVNTPVRRVYYATQIILSGDVGFIEIESDIKEGLEALAIVFEGTVFGKNIIKAQRAASNSRFYSVLCALKPLLKVEDELLNTSSSKFAAFDANREIFSAMAS
jgi:flagellar protein FlbT